MKECPNCNLCFDDELNQCPHDNETLFVSNKCKMTLSGRYVLERRLGKGGMGSVYRAKHKFLKSLHAIKIISPDVVKDDPTLLVRFHQEAVLAASIHHPNVVAVTDFGVTNEDTPFLVMEYIEGISLDDFLRQEKQISPTNAFEILKPIALGVAEAHSKGITHRDLKPLNVMIKKGYPFARGIKVLDFGLAKIKSTESFASLVQAKTTKLLGSPHYMPPEQWANEGVDARSDIYSMGVILFQMLIGEVPFKGDSIPTIMYQHLQMPPPSFASFGVSTSPQIESIVQKALAKEQNQRFSTIEDFLSEYEKAVFNANNEVRNISNNKTVSSFEQHLPLGKVKLTQESEKSVSNDLSKTYNLSYLDSAQNKTLGVYFSQPKPIEFSDNETLEQEFIHAQNRVEEARTKVFEADKLAQEFNEAQKAAEDARQKVIQAQQKLEEDVRRRMQAEMEGKLAAERKAREKAEAEASRLVEEAKARQKAEERANELAKAALEAQHRAEEERQKAEREAHKRQLEESTRRKAEEAALKLAQEVAEAKKRYEEAKKEAEYEAHYRLEAEAKRKKVDEEIRQIAKHEAEKRNLAEAQATYQIKQHASRLEKQALEAEQKATEAGFLAKSEINKREQAETARIKAEQEARRLAEEIIESQKRLEEAQQLAQSESEKRTLEEIARKKAEESARSLSEKNSAENFAKNLPVQAFKGGAFNDLSSNKIAETSPALGKDSLGQLLVNTSSTDVSNTNLLPLRKSFNSFILLGGLFTLLIVSGFGVFMLYYKFSPSSQTAVNTSVKSNVSNGRMQTPSSSISDRWNKKMVLIKGGTFQMGRSDVDPDVRPFNSQFPAHNVVVDDFYIDITEVSNEEYSEFLQATKKKAPENWQNEKPPLGQEKFPVTYVSNFDAREFADWISKRDKILCELPTEEQWEYAARSGNKQNIYPWGNQWTPGRANIDLGYPTEVGKTEDETSDGGIKDMMGNVMEWTSTRYKYYPSFPKKWEDPQVASNYFPTVRGTSFMSSPDQAKNHNYLLTFRRAVLGESKEAFLGFRLVCKVH